MGRRPTTPTTLKRRFLLDVEALELRLTPTAATLTIPLDPTGDRYGDQIVTVQAYQDTNRVAFGIFDTGASAHPGPYAALVNMQGANLDFSSTVPGLSLSLPDLTFVNPGYKLTPQSGSIGPVTIPLVMTGTDNHGRPGNSITESQSPLQN